MRSATELLSFRSMETTSWALSSSRRVRTRSRRRPPSPCLILLDLKMPVMDGVEFLKLRNADPEIAPIPVIMLTGSVELEGRDRELNFQGFVKKPFDPDALSHLVRQYCD